MYRGDDIYLLNWWPLDNQNTVGGGAAKTFGETCVALHAGMQRLDLPSQFQQVPSPRPYTLGATNVTILDRPRTVETAKITHLVRGLSGRCDDGRKLALYGEAHQMAAGVKATPPCRQIPPARRRLAHRPQVALHRRAQHVRAFSFHTRAGSPSTIRSSPTSFANDSTTKARTRRCSRWPATSTSRLSRPVGRLFAFPAGATESATSLDRYDEHPSPRGPTGT
jgi:maltoporin